MLNLAELLKEVSDEMVADGIEINETVAFDTAKALLDNPQIKTAARKIWGEASDAVMIEIVAGQLG